MMSNKHFRISHFYIFFCLFSSTFQVKGQTEKLISNEVETARTDAYQQQLETYLRHYLIDEYEERSAKAWNRDYSSIDALQRSVETNRKRWEAILGPPDLRKSGPLTSKPYVLGDIQAEWIELPLGTITAQAILAFPVGATKQKPSPVVIVQHGIGGSPEATFTTEYYN